MDSDGHLYSIVVGLDTIIKHECFVFRNEWVYDCLTLQIYFAIIWICWKKIQWYHLKSVIYVHIYQIMINNV
jgi:hypothetical protein